MYNAPTEDAPSSPTTGKYLRLGLIISLGIAIFVIIASQGVTLFMNVTEFDDEFTKPLIYSVVSSAFLSAIVLVRTNLFTRTSIFWYIIYTIISIINNKSNASILKNITTLDDYKLSSHQFAIWQITKILLFGAFFSNIMFGFAITYVLDGHILGLDKLLNIFSLPFITPNDDPTHSLKNVVPMIPSLLILIPPILTAIGLRLLIYTGLHRTLSVFTLYLTDIINNKPRYLNYVSSAEFIIGIGVLWFAFNLFFTDQIDYNTKYSIIGSFLIGFSLIFFSFLDKSKARVFTHILKRDLLIRLLTISLIAIIIIAIMSVNNSIADARKIEYLGPYTAQQIGINRYLGDLEKNAHMTYPYTQSLLIKLRTIYHKITMY